MELRNDLGMFTGLFTFNYLIHVFKRLLDVPLFELLFRAQERIVFYGILRKRTKTRKPVILLFLLLAANTLPVLLSCGTKQRCQSIEEL